MTEWVYCPKGRGYLHEGDSTSTLLRHFKTNSVGIRKSDDGVASVAWLIGTNETWRVPTKDVIQVDVLETGDKYPKKICNICHCLLPVDDFDPNQNNLRGVVRRPSCRKCRTDIDKRAPKTRQANIGDTRAHRYNRAFYLFRAPGPEHFGTPPDQNHNGKNLPTQRYRTTLV